MHMLPHNYLLLDSSIRSYDLCSAFFEISPLPPTLSLEIYWILINACGVKK